jgi:hypothetical protein
MADVTRQNEKQGTLKQKPGYELRNLVGSLPSEKDVLEDWFQSWLKRQARNDCERLGIHFDALATDVLWKFHNALTSEYSTCFDSARKTGIKGEALGRRYGCSRENAWRWLHRENDPKLSSFAVVSAAEDESYPPGHMVALRAYQRAIGEVRKKTGPDEPAIPSTEEILCLYYQLLHTPWWLAMTSGDTRRLQLAASEIDSYIADRLGDSRGWTVQSLLGCLDKWWTPWRIVRAVVPYEWF